MSDKYGFKESLDKEIEAGTADDVAGAVVDYISTIISAPFDIVDYCVINYILLSKKQKRYFSKLTVLTSAVIAVLFVILAFEEIRYLYLLPACVLAPGITFLGSSLKEPSIEQVLDNIDSLYGE